MTGQESIIKTLCSYFTYTELQNDAPKVFGYSDDAIEEALSQYDKEEYVAIRSRQNIRHCTQYSNNDTLKLSQLTCNTHLYVEWSGEGRADVLTKEKLFTSQKVITERTVISIANQCHYNFSFIDLQDMLKGIWEDCAYNVEWYEKVSNSICLASETREFIARVQKEINRLAPYDKGKSVEIDIPLAFNVYRNLTDNGFKCL